MAQKWRFKTQSVLDYNDLFLCCCLRLDNLASLALLSPPVPQHKINRDSFNIKRTLIPRQDTNTAQ